LVLAGESFGVWGLLVASGRPETHWMWLVELQILGLVLPWPWALFAFALGRSPGAPVPTRWKMALGARGGLLRGGRALPLLRSPVELPASLGPFADATLTAVGEIGTVLQLLATVGVLYGLEPSLLRSRGETRWRVKFLALGLSGLFAFRFYLLSQ